MRLLQDIGLSAAPARGFVAVGLCWGAFAGLTPQLKAALGASDGAYGMALFVAAIGAAMAMWLAPRVDSALGGHAMRVMAVAMAAAFLLPGLTQTLTVFAVVMLLAAAASGTLDVLMNAQLSGVEARTGRTLMNLNHAIFSFAYAASAMATGLAREAGLGPVAIFAGVGVIVLAMVPGMTARPLDDGTQTAEGTGGAPMRVIWIGGAITLIAFMAEQATEGWSALHIERGLGGGAAEGATGPAILGLTMGIGRLSGQLLAARLNEAAVIRTAAALAAVGAVTAALAPTIPLAYLGFGILGLGVSVIAPMAFALVGRAVRNRDRMRAIARVATIGYLGFFIGPPAMGFLAEIWGLTASFLFIAGALLAVPVVLVPRLVRDQMSSVNR